jgi:hypothetical protein
MTNPRRLKTPILHYDKAKVIDCPLCKVKAGSTCVRVDGKGSRTHRVRVIRWEKTSHLFKLGDAVIIG